MVELIQSFNQHATELHLAIDRDREVIQEIIDHGDISTPEVFVLWQQIDINNMALIKLQSELIAKIISSIEKK